MWSVAAECRLRCYSKVRARRKMHRGASAGASCIKTLVFPACLAFAGRLSGARGCRGRKKRRALSPFKPPAQAAAASAGGCSAERRTHSGSEQPAARASSSRAAAASATASSKVQKPRRNTSKTKLGLYHVSRRDFVARPASLPEREQRLVLLRPGPLPTPDAGKASRHPRRY